MLFGSEGSLSIRTSGRLARRNRPTPLLRAEKGIPAAHPSGYVRRGLVDLSNDFVTIRDPDVLTVPNLLQVAAEVVLQHFDPDGLHKPQSSYGSYSSQHRRSLISDRSLKLERRTISSAPVSREARDRRSPTACGAAPGDRHVRPGDDHGRGYRQPAQSASHGRETFKHFLLTFHLPWLVPVVAILVAFGALALFSTQLLGSLKAVLPAAQRGRLCPVSSDQ